MLSQMFGSWGARRRSRKISTTRRLGVETLDERRVCAVGVTVSAGTLHITGTAASDNVRVAQTATQLQVTANGQQTNVNRQGVTLIDARLQNGDDTYVGSGVTVAQRVFGEGGNDRLTGGAAKDRLFGGVGYDVLVGNNGDDYLSGGADIDWMYGNGGRDTYHATDGGKPDRLVGVTGQDTIQGDVLQSVKPSQNLNDRTNAIAFFGKTIELQRASVPGAQGIFYRVRINGQPWQDLYRAANTITLFTPRFGGSTTIDPTLRSELEAQGWLRFGSLA